MKWHKYFIALGLLLFSSLPVLCQGTKYMDSAIQEETIIEAPQEEVVNNSEETNADTQTVYVDTSLVNNQLVLSRDSVQQFKDAPAFSYAKILDSLLKDYQYKQQAGSNSNVKEEPPSFLDRFFASELTEIFFWTIAALFIGFIVYKLFFTAGFFQGPSAKIAVTVLDEEIKDVDGKADYDSLISQAARNNNFRLAVRYLYLQTLQKLTLTGAIDFAVDKTNAAYLQELSGKPYRNDFASLTLHYEYVWYGEFAINEAAFKILENRFREFKTRL